MPKKINDRDRIMAFFATAEIAIARDILSSARAIITLREAATRPKPISKSTAKRKAATKPTPIDDIHDPLSA
jgi:hypothetical protein